MELEIPRISWNYPGKIHKSQDIFKISEKNTRISHLGIVGSWLLIKEILQIYFCQKNYHKVVQHFLSASGMNGSTKPGYTTRRQSLKIAHMKGVEMCPISSHLSLPGQPKHAPPLVYLI